MRWQWWPPLSSGHVQIRQFHLQRRDMVAVELARTSWDAEFNHSFRLISALPSNASAEELIAGGPAMEGAALAIGIRYEAMGLLVYRGVMPTSLVAQLSGAVALDL